MAATPEEPSSPVLANVVVIVGFALLFTTFVTDSPWSWILGGALLLAGGLWAGFAGSGAARPETTDDAPEPVEGARAVEQGATPPAEPASGRIPAGDGPHA